MRLCRERRQARADRTRAKAGVDRVRGEGGLSRRLRRATRARRAGADAWRNAALRPSVHLARQRRGPLARTAPLVSRPARLCRAGLTAPSVRNGWPPVAAERLRPQLHARGRLAALVLGPVDEGERPLDDVGGKV